jgi:hypothetical protein
MGLAENLIGLGMPAEHAATLAAFTVSSAPALTSAGGLTATGTTIADALQLTTFVNRVSTTAASTGVKLPDAPIGSIVFVQNNGANALNLFPINSSGTLNNGSAGAAVTIATSAANICVRENATNWFVFVLAKES